MRIQSVNNSSFTSKVRINKNIVNGAMDLTTVTSTGMISTGGLTASGLGTTASHVVGSASNVIGSAFVSKASGLNSSGIVPAAMQSAAPHVTPATVASSHNHPSTMGLLMSTIGDIFHSFGKVQVNVKKPN